MKKLAIYLIYSFLFTPFTIAQPLNLRIAKNRVIEHYESGAFEQECKQIIDQAIHYLESNKDNFSNSKSIIFDVDDTILLAFYHLKTLDFCDCCGDRLFNEFVTRADAPTIVAVKQLYDYCANNNYHIFFLTSRSEELYDATIQNLALHGYTKFDRLICKSHNEKHLKAIQYKSSQRAQLVSQGYDIVACVGDQPTDLEGPYIGYVVKIPNYTHILK